MSVKIRFGLAVLFLISICAIAEPTRSLRKIERVKVETPAPAPLGADLQVDTLFYEDPNKIVNYFPLPSEFGDQSYNVRFSPPYSPYRLVGALIPLHRFASMGRPGIKVTVWQSTDIDGDPGYPGESLGSVSVPYESLRFDSLAVAFNAIDLRSLGINAIDSVDFHIGVDQISDDNLDSLGIFLDNGLTGSQEGRSVIWSAPDNAWLKIKDTFHRSYNFVIRAIIRDDSTQSIRVLNPDGAPAVFMLNPAWPNPFNGQTNFRFQVGNGSPYQLELRDSNGRLLELIRSGKGSGSEELSFAPDRLPGGVYFLRLQSGQRSATRPLIYLR